MDHVLRNESALKSHRTAVVSPFITTKFRLSRMFDPKAWLLERIGRNPAALSLMRLGPEGNTANPLMVGSSARSEMSKRLKCSRRFNFLRGTATMVK
jgi:hypothetical protein